MTQKYTNKMSYNVGFMKALNSNPQITHVDPVAEQIEFWLKVVIVVNMVILKRQRC